jgi:hypothetical protein
MRLINSISSALVGSVSVRVAHWELAVDDMASKERQPVMRGLGLCPQWRPRAKPLVRGPIALETDDF